MAEDVPIPKIEEKKPQTVSEMMFDGDPCQPNLILTKLKQTRLWTEKKKVIEKVITSCAPKCKNKKKRGSGAPKMSSWICYNKHCAKDTGKKYMECVGDASRKDKEYTPKKDFWVSESDKGCPL